MYKEHITQPKEATKECVVKSRMQHIVPPKTSQPIAVRTRSLYRVQ